MARVRELIPGDLVYLHSPPGRSAVFIAETAHPLYPGLRLVVWKLGDGTWSHDALHLNQEVGEVRTTSDAERQRWLRQSLLHRSQW